jgi:hypothetical protein
MSFQAKVGKGLDLPNLQVEPAARMGGRYFCWAQGDDFVSEGKSLGTRQDSPKIMEISKIKDERGRLIPIELDRALGLIATALRERNNPYFEVYLSQSKQWRRATPSWVLSEDNLAELFGEDLRGMNPRALYQAIWNRYQSVGRWTNNKSVSFSAHEKLFVSLFSLGSYLHYSKKKDRVANWPTWGVKKDSPDELKNRLLKDLESGSSDTSDNTINFRQRRRPKKHWKDKVIPVVKEDAIAAGVGIAALATSLGLVALVDKMSKAKEPLS